jgi:hypothetical protein
MKSKYYIIAGVLAGIIVLVYYFNYTKNNFSIIDKYTDSTSKGKFVFLFVETESVDKTKMIDFGKDLKSKKNYLDMPDKTIPAIMTIYFYHPKDTVKLGEGIRNSLKRRYTNNPEMVDRINFIQNGWQYIGYNSKMLPSVARDTIFKTLVFIPKPGFKAKDIISERKSHND